MKLLKDKLIEYFKNGLAFFILVLSSFFVLSLLFGFALIVFCTLAAFFKPY